MPIPAEPSGTALRHARLGNAYDREVAGAAAKIRDQHGGRLGQTAGIAERCAERLVDIVDFGAEFREHRIVALPRQDLVGPGTGISHRPADHDARRTIIEPAAGMGNHAFEKIGTELLEGESLLEDIGMLEQGACRDRLERLEEPAAFREGEIFGNGPRARFAREATARSIILPEAEGRAEHGTHREIAGKLDQFGLALSRDRGDAVRRAEVETQRPGFHHARHGTALRERRGAAYRTDDAGPQGLRRKQAPCVGAYRPRSHPAALSRAPDRPHCGPDGSGGRARYTACAAPCGRHHAAGPAS